MFCNDANVYKKNGKRKKSLKKVKKRLFFMKKNMGRTKQPYRLILTLNGCERESMGAFTNELLGRKKMQTLSNASLENTVIPKKFVSTKTIHEAQYELVLIKKRDENDPISSLVKDEMGEYVEHKASNEMWLVIDKMPYYIEEEFWVYGFHPLTDRKTFPYIFDNILSHQMQDKYALLTMGVYKNKVVLEGSNGVNLVICKNTNDAIRLYNAVQEKALKQRKYRYISCLGDCNSTRVSRERIIEVIQNLTNWNKQKIIRNTTKTQRK